MKKIYETAEVNIILFAKPEAIVASSAEGTIDKDPDDLPIMPADL